MLLDLGVDREKSCWTTSADRRDCDAHDDRREVLQLKASDEVIGAGLGFGGRCRRGDGRARRRRGPIKTEVDWLAGSSATRPAQAGGARGRDPKSTPVSLVMTRDVSSSRRAPREAALSLIHVNRYRHLLVIDGPQAYGLISIGDLARQLIEQGEGRFEAAVRKRPRRIETVVLRHGVMRWMQISTRRRTLLPAPSAPPACGLPVRACGLHASAPDGETMASNFNVKLDPAGPGGASARRPCAALQSSTQRMSWTGGVRVDVQPGRVGRAGPVSAELVAVLAAARHQPRSNGAFDVTVAPAVEHGASGQRAAPRAGGRTVARTREGRLACAGPGPGAPDRQQGAPASRSISEASQGLWRGRRRAIARRLGIAHYMIEVGGEVRARGVNAAGEPWQIGIEEPDAMPQRARHIVPLSGRAMATSGDYRIYFEEGGRRYRTRSTRRPRHRSRTGCAWSRGGGRLHAGGRPRHGVDRAGTGARIRTGGAQRSGRAVHRALGARPLQRPHDLGVRRSRPRRAA